MKNLTTFLIATVMLLTEALIAQQPAQYSLYQLNKFAFNPAYAGLANSLNITGVYRTQWVGLPGAPVTQNLNAHLPMYITGGGMGLVAENETIGSWRQTSLAASYAHHLAVGKTGLLSLGLSAGWVQRQLDGSKVRTPSTVVDDFGNPIDHNDNFSVNLESGAGATMHIGAFYQGEKLEFGISATNLLGNEVGVSGLGYRQERTYFCYAGYKLNPTRTISILPSILAKSDVHQTQVDFSLTTYYNENIFVGGSFRGYRANSIDAVALMGGFKLSEKIAIAYGYDLGISNLQHTHSGSHEVLLTYNLGTAIGKGKLPSIIYNPRSL